MRLARKYAWHPMASAPKDGTIVDLWIYRPYYRSSRNGHLSSRMAWGSSAERDPKSFGPDGLWPHLSLTGWYEIDSDIDDAGSIFIPDQFSHWQLHMPEINGRSRPTHEQFVQHELLMRLRGIDVSDY